MISAVLNVKGGCGKTTLSEMLVRAYAKAGFKTLAVDNDGQGNLTNALLPQMDFEADGNTITDVIRGTCDIHEAIVPVTENLDLLPANLDLFNVTYELQAMPGGDFILSQKLKQLDYDMIVIDNNPSLNKMTYNAIYCADRVLCPTSISKKTLKGIINTQKICKQALNNLPAAKPLDFKIVVEMVKPNKITKDGIEQLREAFGDDVLKQTIRYQGKPILEAEYAIKPLLENEKTGVTKDYKKLTNEILSLDNLAPIFPDE